MLKNHTFHHYAPIHLEDGEFLPELELGYTTYGELNEDKSNVVWVCHAFTGNANPSDWWAGLIGENRLFNPKEHFVICVNVPGSHYGSSNPLSVNPDTGKPFFFSFPMLTIRDVIQCFELLRADLGIEKIHTLMGGSLGGQQAVEWAVSNPDLFENLILFSTNAIHSPWGIAFNESQRMAIASDPTWQEPHENAGKEGMKVARSIALLSYRNYETYNRTQSRDEGQINFFRASTYQSYQGEKIKKRFNAYSYWVLSRMFDSHDVSRGRGSIADALSKIKAKTLVIGISSDMLFPIAEQEVLGDLIPGATFARINSTYGHDGFLIEFEQMTNVIKNWQS
ncbi:homoserine O-acetyltransferase [uncultured Arcticibacterium sp.]|uniref:homoserine O-acetyltransferase family protein n=1 Tax=uncultured Arcticibacterium sp. TaxID=2173042 RepID=UPI0030F8773E